MAIVRIGLLGDYRAEVRAHRAIPVALELAAAASGCDVEAEWLATDLIELRNEEQFAGYDGLWCVPASPYASMEGALWGIQFARERRRPFLGTCGGFQHTLIEHARNVLGIREADHAESSPDASVLFITPLTCALRGVKGPIKFVEGSRIAAIYGASDTVEGYNCSFGLNPQYGSLLDDGNLNTTGMGAEGESRVVELKDHPFFIATLYQPELSAMEGVTHPLITAFVQAAERTKT